MKFRDRLWIWGQDPGCHHRNAQGVNTYNLPGVNRMDARQGCDWLGLSRCCRVAMWSGPFPPFDAEAEKIRDLDEVVWSAIGAGGVQRHNDDRSDLDEVLRMAARYPNVRGAVLDDFFTSVQEAGRRPARHSIESIRAMRERLHGFPGRPLELWMVWYSYQFGFDVQDYVDLADVLTLWVWKGSELDRLEAGMQTILARTPGKRRLAGCYLWNYGERCPLSLEAMQRQCETYREWIHKGWIEGIIFCSNCICDVGLETAEWTRRWIAEVGDEEC